MDQNPNKNSLKGCSIPQLDDHIKNFIHSYTSRGVPISYRIIATEVKLAARKKYEKNLKGNYGCITNLMKQIDRRVKKTHGEANAVDEQVGEERKEKLSALLQNYPLKDVYNMDELGLYFDLLPSASYVIGKSNKPLCYKEKEVKKPPINYSSNKTA